jgi:putative transposase
VSFGYLVAVAYSASSLLPGRSRGSKELEIVLLRLELAILMRHTRRPRLTARDRLVLGALSRVLPRRSWRAFPAGPERLLRWQRPNPAARLREQRPGRCSVRRRVAQARDHHLDDASAKCARALGHPVGAATRPARLARVPTAARRVGARRRFVHRRRLAAPVARAVFVSIGTRRVDCLACTSNPNGTWMAQQARNLRMDLESAASGRAS